MLWERTVINELARPKASISFMRDRSDGGIFSSRNPQIMRMNLEPVELNLIEMRDMAVKPSIEREGFTLAEHAIDGDWSNRAWLDATYVPSCLDLVKRLTGAKAALNIYFPIERRSEPAEGAAPPANFLHFDQTRAGYLADLQATVKRHGAELGRAAVFNVWKAISPPPQAMPLALCDQRDVPASDHVEGMTIEGEIRSPHVGVAVPECAYPVYYVPDMQIDKSLVFLAVNMDENAPLGVPHMAIYPPGGPEGLPVRRSIELRVLALFD